jgi:hypothetical protein
MKTDAGPHERLRLGSRCIVPAPRTCQRTSRTVAAVSCVDIDHRGLAYAVDRVGTGLFILEYTGKKSQTN